MANVTLILPQILIESIGSSRIRLKSSTLKDVFDQVCAKKPALRLHLFDNSGRLRVHLLCFHNEKKIRDIKSPDVPLKEGDEITILQAISGG